MKMAVVYARYSSDSQTEQSIDGQLHVCEDYAKDNDIIILDTYIDRAMTGRNDHRPAFQKMIKDSKKSYWDYVLVYKFDRFSRNKYETAIYKKTLKDNGIKLMSATEYLPDSPERIIIESIFEGYAEYYSAELSQKVSRGMRENRIKGKFTGGCLAFGYKLTVDKHIIIDEDAAKIVRYIFEQYAIGYTVKEIIQQLKTQGITYRNGEPFNSKIVYKMLQNEKYSGIYTCHGEVFDKLYPKIVSEDVFEITRHKAEYNSHGRQSEDTIYLLRNKVRCGYCGSSVTGESGTGRNKTISRYYKCKGRKQGNGCNKSMIRKETLENFVIDEVLLELKNPSKINTLVKFLLDEQKKNPKESEEIKQLLKDKEEIEKSINNLVKAIEKGATTKSTISRLKECEEKQEEIEKSILIAKNKERLKPIEKDIQEFYEKAIYKEPFIFVNYIIKRIFLYDDKIEIILNTPFYSNPDIYYNFEICHKIVKQYKHVQNKKIDEEINIDMIMKI